MKFNVLTCFLSILAYGSFAQSVTPILIDDLVADKSAMLSKIIPAQNGELLYSNYALAPQVFIAKANQFKLVANQQINREKNKALNGLRKKDIAFFARNTVENYRANYGTDSVAKEEVYKISNEKRADPNFNTLIQEAAKKVQVKRLSNEEAKLVEDFITGGVDLNDAELYKHSMAYRDWLDTYIYKLSSTKYAGSGLAYEDKKALTYEIINKELKSGFIKDYLAYQAAVNALEAMTSQDKIEKLYKEFISSTNNRDYIARVNEVYNNIILSRPNVIAPDFKYADVDGRQVSLAALRGKFVYIDVWATWCGPCKAEIPSLKQLEEDYHAKNITFVSISVDVMADKEKWTNYVKKNNLGGIQVLADKDFSAEFIQKFNITTIPRFILIDPEGKIVSPNAARPSDPGLRNQFDALLK